MSIPLLLGHRGARRHAPENTITAFELALQHGCDGFEFDVRMTSDHRCIVCHDARYGHTEVARSTLSPLRTRGEFPELAEVVALFAGRAFLDIELKVAGLEEPVLDLIGKHGMVPKCVVSSFLAEAIAAVREIEPTVPTGLIFDRTRIAADWRKLPIDYVIAEQSLVSQALIREAHGQGRKVLCWTVNRADDMLRLQDWEVDGIISDDTKLLCATVGGRP